MAPTAAFAQKDQFFDALLPLYRAAAGTYGDEGPQLNAAITAMSQALARGNATLAEAETNVRAQLPGATPQVALQMHTVLGSMYLEHGRFADALREFDQDLLIDPKRAIFHRLKGTIHQAQGRRAEAADAFHGAWLADPADPQNAYQLLVTTAAATTDAERSQARVTLAALERALVQGQQSKAGSPFLSVRPIDDAAGGAMAFAPAAYATAIAKLLNGELDAGLAGLRDVVARDPLVADPALRSEPVVRGITALRNGQVSAAVEALKSALTILPASAEVRRLLATAEIVQGDVEPALAHLRDAVKLDPKNERAWLALTRELDDIGDDVAAAEALRAAVKELPDSGELRWQLLVVSGKRQRTDAVDLELIATADRLTLLVGNAELYSRVAQLAQAHLDYDRAIALLQQAVVLAPNNPNVHEALGRALIDQGRENEGYAELVIALWLDPADADTLSAIGKLHLTTGGYPEAVDALTRAFSLDPTDAQIVHTLGEALVRAGRADEGRQHLESAGRLQERAVEAQRRARTAGMLSVQAEVAKSEGNAAGVIELWRNAADLEPRDSSIRLRLADALVATNRGAEAAAELERIIPLNAGPDVHRRLANVYAALGRADDSARERRVYTDERLRELHERSGEVR